MRSYIAPWQRLFDELAVDSQRVNSTVRLVTLYPQDVHVALLRRPDNYRYSVHLKHNHPRFRQDIFALIKPFLQKGARKADTNGFDYYEVLDWDGLARVVRNVSSTALSTPKEPDSQPLRSQPVSGSSLSTKDDSDVEAVASARSFKQRKLHNTLTNSILAILPTFVLTERLAPGPRYDALILDYDGNGNDLLIGPP